jgi:ATP-binding cassette subfamily B protein
MQEVKKPMQRLFRYMRPFKGHLYFSVISSVLNKIIDLMPPLIIGWAVDAASLDTPGWIESTFELSTVSSIALFFAGFIVVAFLFESLFEWMFSYGFMTLAQKVQHHLRMDAYKHLQSREIAYFEQQRTGNIMAILNDDINQLERFLNDSFNQIIQLFTLYIFAALTMGAMSWKLTLISLFPIPLILIGSFFYQRKIGPFYQLIRQTVGALASRLENNISGIMVIKSFTAENYEAKRLEEVSEEYMKANHRAIQWNAAYIPIIRMFIAFGFAVGMFTGIYWVMNGQEGMTAGGLTFFAMMIQRILWPITRLGKVVDEYERAKASARRVFGLMDSPNQLPQLDQPVKVERFDGAIEIEGVHFHYDEAMPILRGISFGVQQGETIGIAGTTGAGKTTLIKLLLRLYDVTQGSIKIDGIDLREMDIRGLRRQIAVVSQEVYLFHGTIRENIAYGNAEANEEMIIQAAKKAQLHDFIMSLPNGYDSLVGERGIKLSGGQRQRLSIARAILKDAPILILDEATSAVDTETERAIQENLDQLTQGRTAFIIAHRLSTLRRAHNILVLKAGQIVEQGSHEDLLKQKGIYEELWRIQTGVLEV